MVISENISKMLQEYLVESLTGRNAGYWQDKDMSGPDDMKLNVRRGSIWDSCYSFKCEVQRSHWAYKLIGREQCMANICFWALAKNGCFSHEINQSQRIDKMSENRE